MKKLLLPLVLLTLFQLNSLSQSEWAPIGAKWYYHTVSGGPAGLLIITSIEDTLILNENCRELKFEHIFINQNSDFEYYLDTATYYNYFYYEQDKVYHYDTSGYFYKLYDFSINTGDTVLVRDSSFEGDFSYEKFEYVVDSIDTINVGNTPLSTFYTSPSKEADWCFSTFADNYPIIEKIGSTQRFLGTSKVIAISYSSWLKCYIDQEIYYRSDRLDDTASCDYIDFSLNRNTLPDVKFGISPNPFSDRIRISTQSPTIDQVQIFNILGNLKYECMNLEGNSLLQLNFLPDGIYIVKIKIDNTNFSRLIIKK